MKIRLHSFAPGSRANGPGLRAVVWFQGCSLGCPGCFNPSSHQLDGGMDEDSVSVANDILALSRSIDGVTFSGGEPLEQAEGLVDILDRLEGHSLGKLVFTGFSWRELQSLPYGPDVLERVDAVIAGRYVQTRHHGRDLLGSTNQEIYLLTGRYTREDFRRVPRGEAVVHPDGRVTLTGVSPPRFTFSARSSSPRPPRLL